MENHNNKVALIIGGTSGIGKATAELLLKNGAKVYIVGRNVSKVADQDNLFKITADITKKDQLDALNAEIEKIGKVDYLVNASGIFGPKPFLSHTLEDYDSYLNLNRGFFFLTQKVASLMKANQGGSIVNIGSMWAKQAVKATPSSAYSMQKAGLHSFTQHLAMELSDHNIRVNAVSPAVVDTPVYHGVFGGEEAAKEALVGFNNFHPIGRNGTAKDIALTIVHLLSEDSSWITGSIIDIDGGVMAGRN